MSSDTSLRRDYAQKDDAYYAHARHEMLRYIPPGIRRALDVGCASGEFGQIVQQERQCAVWGVEPYAPAAESACARLERVFCAGFSPELALPPASFDVILCNDVLEHLADPFEALRYARTLLAPGGVIVASVPNVRYFPVLYQYVAQAQWQYADFGVLDRTHLRFFTHRSLRQTFHDCGYEVVTLEGIRPDRTWKWRLLNALTLNRLADTAFPQFAVVARPNAG
jgi:2-polyprenyl-3-methyl-5-hydroxy-6-metoxy-1,4-benzoquinol methylase